MAKRHPRGLYPLFFTEMWERLAFYTIVNILLLYTTDVERGGLGLPRAEGNEIYGLYLAFVYFTPFPGGMLADRYLGYRKAVFIGGVFMATGLFMMSVPGTTYFISGLILLIIGNGFFKPNISVMVGNLYAAGDERRDSGFNIFYMGINVGALSASLLSPAVRNEWGWLWTFRVAGIGLVISLAVLLASWKLLAPADRTPERRPDDVSFGTVLTKILLPAFAVGLAGYAFGHAYMPDGPVRPGVLGFLFGIVPVLVFFIRLGRTAPKTEAPGLRALLPLYVTGATFFMILHLNGSALTQWARDTTDRDTAVVPEQVFGVTYKQEALPRYYTNAGEDVPRPDPRSLLVADRESARMFGQTQLDEHAVDAIANASAGISVRDVDEDTPEIIAARSVSVHAGDSVDIEETSDGHGGTAIAVKVPEASKPVRQVAFVREVEGQEIGLYVVDQALYDQLYPAYRDRFEHDPELLPPGRYLRVANPEIYQALNALFVILLTPVVVGFFAFVGRRKKFSTARKMFWGLVFTTLSLVVMAIAGIMSEDGHVKVSGMWLVGFYSVVTIGELFLSPMGLSLVTKLTPKRLVGLAMGGWFMATAFGNNLSGFFGGIQGSLSPVNFFLVLAGLSSAAAMFIRVLLPRLEKTIEQYGA